MFKSNQQIIDEISKIVEPLYKFETENIISYSHPQIEKLDVLHFKFNNEYHKLYSKLKEENMIKEINDLNIGDVEIVKYSNIGKFIVIKLHTYNNRLIGKYNKYLNYKNLHTEKINNIYHYLGEAISEEFIAYVLFYEKNN